MTDYRNASGGSCNEAAMRIKPWSAQTAADHPTCHVCTWAYSLQGKTFRLKFTSRACAQHKHIPNA